LAKQSSEHPKLVVSWNRATPKHPSHDHHLVLKRMVTWGTPYNLQIAVSFHCVSSTNG
jgi:hypothetical protein